MNITNEEIDALKEMINIGVGSGADVMNTMLNSPIQLQVPYLRVILPEELDKEIKAHDSGRFSAVNLSFKGSFLGTAELVFPAESAAKLVKMLTNQHSEMPNVDSIRSGTLTEVGNIVLNAVMGTISNILDLSLSYSVPNYVEGNVKNLMVANKINFDTVIMLARTRFLIEELEIEGDILLFLEVESFGKLLKKIDAFNACLGAGKA
ncbi:chemotaxis protein CheC [Planctomycetota bacterium]